MSLVTGTDARRAGWTINDDVMRLRVWGTDRIFMLPVLLPNSGMAYGDWFIGTAEECLIRLSDPSRRISRRHARLVRSVSHWSLLDIGSKNGIRVNGVKQPVVRLDPGAEIEIGGLMLVAESSKSIELRTFLTRLIGWSEGCFQEVDRALRGLRTAQTLSAPVVLRGDDDLVAIAHDLHRRVYGPGRPFVTCDPKRHSSSGDVRLPANVVDGRDAFEQARGGTLCVLAHRQPSDFEDLLEAHRNSSGTQTQLMICDDGQGKHGLFLPSTITIPTLASRGVELAHIIYEYANDAARSFALPSRIYPDDNAWILEHSASSFAEIGKGARRLAALRAARTLSGAAALLGMAPVSLRRWIGRRSLPVPVDDSSPVAR